jgi:hypothetical protein
VIRPVISGVDTGQRFVFSTGMYWTLCRQVHVVLPAQA